MKLNLTKYGLFAILLLALVFSSLVGSVYEPLSNPDNHSGPSGKRLNL